MANASPLQHSSFAILIAPSQCPCRRDSFGMHPSRDHFFWGIRSGRIDRTDEGDDLPEIIRGFDGKAHRWHWRVHRSVLDPVKTLFFDSLRAQRNEPEQHIIGVAPEPRTLRQGRAHAAAAAAAMTLVATREAKLLHEILLLGQLGIVRIGTMQLAR